MSSKTTKKIKPLTKLPAKEAPPSPSSHPAPASPAPAPAPPSVTIISIPDEEGGGPPLSAINVVPDGDVVLDITFDLSKETLRAARKANAAIKPRPKPGTTHQPKQPAPQQQPLKSNTRLLYRTHLAILKQHSNYFTSLLSDPRFAETKSITAAFEKLSLDKIKPSQADIKDLPRVKIAIDDEETQLAGQEAVFGDLLRMLHGQVIVTDPLSMAYLSTLAVLADRFGCAEAVGKSLHGRLKFKAFKWPATQVRLAREEDGVALTRAAEDVLRQKIYVSWLLDLPLRFQKATGELVMYGSRQWKEFEDEESVENNTAAWWYLPDELEGTASNPLLLIHPASIASIFANQWTLKLHFHKTDELRHRRTCILSTIASIPAHFIALYSGTAAAGSSRPGGAGGTRQCKLGYDSSASCDSYQLGETLKFLLKRNLISLSYFSFSPSSPISPLPDSYATTEINQILSTMKQFPSYQIDKHHTNCGPRTRLKPILDFLTPMVSHKSVSLSRLDWVKRRDEVSWLFSSGGIPLESKFDDDRPGGGELREGDRDSSPMPLFVNGKFQAVPSPLSFSVSGPAGQGRFGGNLNGGGVDGVKKKRFTFMRSMAGDQRLRFEGSMGADRLVRGLFTADEWDWTPEDS